MSIVKNAPAEKISQIYRYSYPAVFAISFLIGLSYLLGIFVASWKQSIRDEVYLIGEQLHNHEEEVPPATAQVPATAATAIPVANA